jgi:hypothetical protein
MEPSDQKPANAANGADWEGMRLGICQLWRRADCGDLTGPMVERPRSGAGESDEDSYIQSDEEVDAGSRIQSRKALGRCKDLWAAVQDDDQEEARFALDAGADVNWKNPEEGCYTALMLGSSMCFESMVRLLLEHEADVNATSKLGNTALMMAARSGSGRSCSLCELLLEHGADMDAQNLISNNTALLIGTQFASLYAHTTLTSLLLLCLFT